MDNFFSRLFSRNNRKQTTRKTSAKKPRRDQLNLEALEARITPAVKIWTGAALDHLWSDGANWGGAAVNNPGVAPVNGDTIQFDTNLLTAGGAAQVAAAYSTIDDIHNLVVGDIHFSTAAQAVGAQGGAAGGPQLAANPFAYTINGNATTGSLIITTTAAANGIRIDGPAAPNGAVNGNALAGFTETIGTTVATAPALTLNSALAGPTEASFTDSDPRTQLTINSTIVTNFVGADADVLDVTVVGGATDNAAVLGVNLNGVISGNMDLQKDGTGTLSLGAVNTYTGPTSDFRQSINSGVVIVQASNGAGSGLGANDVVTPADTIVNGQAAATAGQILLANGVTVAQRLDLNSNANGGVAGAIGGGLATNGALATWAGPVQLDVITTGAAAAAAPAQTLGAGANARLLISGVISGGGDAAGNGPAAAQTNLTIEGGGTVEFGTDNTYFGETTVGAAGQGASTLSIDSGSGLGVGTQGGVGDTTDGTIVTAGSTVIFTGNFTVQSAAANPENFALTGLGVNNLGAMQVAALGTVIVPGSITLNGIDGIGVNSATGQLDDKGALLNGAPSGELVKIGLGTMLLDNVSGTTSNYTAGTEIRGGILQDRTVTNRHGLGSGNVTVDDNTTLQMGYSAGPTGIDITNSIVFQGVNPAAGALGSLEQVASGVAGGLLDRITGNIQLLAAAGSQVLFAVDTAPDELVLGFPAPFGGIITPGGPGTGGGFVLNKPIATGAAAQPNGILDLDGPNTYGGTTTVDEGRLQLIPQAAGQIEVPGALVIGDRFPNPVTGAVTNATAIVQLHNFSNSIAATSVVTLDADGELDLNGFSNTIAGLNMTGADGLGGGGSVIGAGASELTLNGDVTATGFLDGAGVFHEATISVATLALNTNGGNRTFTVNEPVTLPPITPFVQPDLFITSVIQNNTAPGLPASNLIKAGPGSLYLSGANTYTGTTTINLGFLSAQNASALGVGDNTNATAVTVAVAGAPGAALLVDAGATIAGHILNLNGAGYVDPVTSTAYPALGGFGGGAGWAGLIHLQTNSTIGSLPAGGSFTLSNVIDGAGNLDILGPNGSFGGGTVIMTAASQTGSAAAAATANSYGTPPASGITTTVEAGAGLTLAKVEVAPGAHPGTPLTAVPGGIEIKGAAPNFPGAVNGIGPVIPGAVVNVNAGIFSGATAGIEIGTLAANKAVTIDSGGTMNIGTGGANAALSIAALTLNVGSTTGVPNANPTININSAGGLGSQLQLTADVTVKGGIGANAAIVGNDGTINQLLLSGTRTFNVLSANPGSTELDLNLAVGIGNAIAPAAVGAIIETGGGTMEMSGAAQNTYGGNTTVQTGALLLGKTADFATGGSAIPANTTLFVGTGLGAPTSVLVTEIADNFQVGGNAVGSGGASIVLNSDGLFDLAGNMDRIGGAVALLMNGGIMGLSGGTLFVDGSINVPNPPSAILQSGTLNFDNGIRTITVGPAGSAPNGANLTISAVIASGGLIKAGAGQLILSAPGAGDTYLQNTTVTDGKLTNDTKLASAVNVIPAAGAGTVTYNGTGTSGPLTAGPAPAGTVANVAPGDSPGTLNVTGDDTFNAGSQFTVLLGAFPGDKNTADFSQLIVSGAANLNGSGSPATAANLNVTVPGSYPVGTTFDILHAANGVTGNFRVGNTLLLDGATFTSADGKLLLINYGPNDVILTLESPQTTTTVSGAPNPQIFGHSVTFTATVTDNTLGTAPTGTVEFYINSVSPANDLGTGTALTPSGNTATSTFTTSTLPSGADTIIAVYNPTGNFQTSQGTTVENIQAVTSSVLTANPNPSNFGQSVTFTDVVTNTSGAASPTGSVTFTVTGTGITFTTSNLVVGGNTVTATWNTPTSGANELPPGVDNVVATYNPTGNFVTSQASINETVNALTTVTASGNPNPVVFGHPVVLTATVTNNSSAASPTGTVEFFDGNTDLGAGTPGTPNGNVETWTFSTTALPSGPQTIKAVYTASPGFQSGSATFIEDVQAVTTSAETSSPNPSNFGQSVTFTDVVTNTSGAASPTGSVTFTSSDGNTFTTSSLVVGGNTVTAQWTTAALAAGVDTVTATYNPTGDFVTSSATINQTVNAATTVAASGNPNPVVFGHVVTLTATVTNTSSAAAPTGTVEFFDGNTDLGAGTPGTPAGNVETWTFATSALPSGPQTIKAVYTAAPGFQSGSATFIEDVQAVTTSAETSSPNPSNFGQSVTFTDVITNTSGSASPTGSVTFTSGALTFTTSNLVVGGNTVTAQWTTSALPAGVDAVTATYNPTGDFVTSSATINQAVNAATTVAASGNPNPVVFGHSVTLTATVTNTSSGTAPQGTVEFFDGNTDLGAGTPGTPNGNVETWTFSTTSLPSGPQTIKAVYTAAAGFQSGSATFTEDVQAGTTTTVTSSANPSVQGNPVTFTATVVNNNGNATPTGTVTFTSGALTFTGTLNGVGNSATATWTTSALPPSTSSQPTDTITAVYNPTGDFLTSSGATQQTVTPVAVGAQVVTTGAVLKTSGEVDLVNQGTGAVTVISGPGTASAISTALNTSGQTIVFAIVTGASGPQFNHTLWEYNPATAPVWTELSPGQFTSISGAGGVDGNGNPVTPVVFGVVQGGALWEQTPAGGANVNWTQLAGAGVPNTAANPQPNNVTTVSAVATTTGPVAYVITQSGGNVWEYNATNPAQHPPMPVWVELSSGSFSSISAGFNGIGQATVYGILSSQAGPLAGSLWEQNPNPSGIGLNVGWTQLSGGPLVGGGGTAPTSFLSADAGAADTVFAIASNNTLWQHKNNGWTQVVTPATPQPAPIFNQFSNISATENKAGADVVFAAMSDGEFWDYLSSATPPWATVLQGGGPFGASAVSLP